MRVVSPWTTIPPEGAKIPSVALLVASCVQVGQTAANAVVEIPDEFSDYRFPQVLSANPTLAEYRKALQNSLGARPDNGVTFTVGGQTLTLPASQGFQDRLTRLLAAYREAGAAGSTNVTIATRNGSRTMTLTQLRAAYKAYMDAAATLNAPLDQVDAAATMADLDAITLQ